MRCFPCLDFDEGWRDPGLSVPWLPVVKCLCFFLGFKLLKSTIYHNCQLDDLSRSFSLSRSLCISTTWPTSGLLRLVLLPTFLLFTAPPSAVKMTFLLSLCLFLEIGSLVLFFFYSFVAENLLKTFAFVCEIYLFVRVGWNETQYSWFVVLVIFVMWRVQTLWGCTE